MNKPKPRQGKAPWPTAVFLLVKGPRTSGEMMDLMGSREHTIRSYLRQLEAEGLVTCEKNGHAAGVWTWNPKP